MERIFSNRPIVVGVDGLPSSRSAFAAAVALARSLDHEVLMVHAAESPKSSLAARWLPASTTLAYREKHEEALKAARLEISDLREHYRGHGVEISQSFVTGPADDAILSVASTHNAGLIVVGTHGRRGLDRLFLGSVAERVARFADCDALVVRGETRFDKPIRILVPTDFSASSGQALAVAGALANGKEITLLHCVDTPVLADGILSSTVIGNYEEALTQELEELAQPLRASGAVVKTLALAGYAAGLIAELANDYDLIVMGSHGRRGVKRWFLGSVAEKTIRRAPCSVYVVRPAATEQADDQA